MTRRQESVLIVGAGPGLSASFARLCAADGMAVTVAARQADKLSDMAGEIGATARQCDASNPASVDALFEAAIAEHGVPDLVLYNPSYRARGAITEINREEVLKALMISCYGGFLVGQKAAQVMLSRGSGSIQFTGASASVKGYPQSASFAMGKFGLRGLAQSMARELHPKGIHIAHFVIDGGISKGADDPRNDRGENGLLNPDAIAETYLQVHKQHRSTWAWEVELRPWVEKF
ncbi:MAG: SDR family NAD(P)-dependent oxidoreductase [Rhodospirillaceae bacterium]|nr:SDR family NAD(P)-dependent oxidoreductase [Rhodospirillaceae bacterium]